MSKTIQLFGVTTAKILVAVIYQPLDKITVEVKEKQERIKKIKKGRIGVQRKLVQIKRTENHDFLVHCAKLYSSTITTTTALAKSVYL